MAVRWDTEADITPTSWSFLVPIAVVDRIQGGRQARERSSDQLFSDEDFYPAGQVYRDAPEIMTDVLRIYPGWPDEWNELWPQVAEAQGVPYDQWKPYIEPG
jgi:hypothetical protein